MTNELLQPELLELSKEAVVNLRQNLAEAERRKQVGLTSSETLLPVVQVADYLKRVACIEPTVDTMTDELIANKTWKNPPRIVACIPIVGTGNQENTSITTTLKRLSKDPLVQSGDVGILLFVNRPEGFPKDQTAQKAQNMIRELDLNAIVMESEIDLQIGNVTGPFSSEMATDTNQVPIGLLRDILNMTAMKLSQRQDQTLPLLLQMDGDFEGFMQGTFAQILKDFTDPNVQCIQYTSDWDSEEYPTDSDGELLLGAQLMRELPQILKNALNNLSLSYATRMQIIFGEAIQRGIQVPQVERMENIAKKGGYGLNRLAHDELDTNLRQSALIEPKSVRSSNRTIFLWNNRRAVKTWQQYRQPPISQWVNPFSVIDPVRQELKTNAANGRSHLEAAVNQTLARFPVPKKLLGVYENFSPAVLAVTKQYFPNSSKLSWRVERTDEDLYYIQFDFTI